MKQRYLIIFILVNSIFICSCDNFQFKDAVPLPGITCCCFPGNPQFGLEEHPFTLTSDDPISTFGVDVDTASYSYARKQINDGILPDKSKLRTEEFINYFTYDYEAPSGNNLLSFDFEIGPAPWQPYHRLVKISIIGKNLPTPKVPPLNLVFLIDVSGSMEWGGRLEMVKYALTQLTNQLRSEDKISIVTYSYKVEVPLFGVSGDQKDFIIKEISKLKPGGGTAGHPGLQKAYEVAKENFIDKGVNRVILSTDGDFNIGISNTADLKQYVKNKAESGILLTVHGYGMDNLNDNLLETIADNGNGSYAFIDSNAEAVKVFKSQLLQSLVLVAKNVKLKVTFNSENILAYRLIGYENRNLTDQEFLEPKTDSGDIGAGQVVTAFYEIEFDKALPPLGEANKSNSISQVFNSNKENMEVLNLQMSYINTEENQMELINETIYDKNLELDKTSENFRFAAATAAFALKLAGSKFISREYSYSKIINLAYGARGKDPDGSRIEFVKLIRKFEELIYSGD